MKKIAFSLATVAAMGAFAPAAFAGGGGSGGEGGGGVSTNAANSTSVSSNQAQNVQNALGTVNQAPIGGINNNTQYNNSQDTDYGFAPGVYCRGPNLSIGGYGARADADTYASPYNVGSESTNFGGFVGFNIPLGNSIAERCKTLAAEIAKQRQLDTDYNMIKICANLKRENVAINYETFPQFEVCDSVALVPIPMATVEEVEVIEEEVPVKGLW